MAYVTVSRFVAAAGLLALGGCAQEGGSRPSFIGLTDLAGPSAAAERQSTISDDTPDVLRHIQSNRVLGAMAFQRMTGQTVDPDSLVRNANQ